MKYRPTRSFWLPSPAGTRLFDARRRRAFWIVEHASTYCLARTRCSLPLMVRTRSASTAVADSFGISSTTFAYV